MFRGEVGDIGYIIHRDTILKVIETKRISCKYKIFENPIDISKK